MVVYIFYIYIYIYIVVEKTKERGEKMKARSGWLRKCVASFLKGTSLISRIRKRRKRVWELTRQEGRWVQSQKRWQQLY